MDGNEIVRPNLNYNLLCKFKLTVKEKVIWVKFR